MSNDGEPDAQDCCHPLPVSPDVEERRKALVQSSDPGKAEARRKKMAEQKAWLESLKKSRESDIVKPPAFKASAAFVVDEAVKAPEPPKKPTTPTPLPRPQKGLKTADRPASPRSPRGPSPRPGARSASPRPAAAVAATSPRSASPRPTASPRSGKKAAATPAAAEDEPMSPKLPPPAKPAASGVGSVVSYSSGLTLGPGVTKDLLDFCRIFQPMAEPGDETAELRDLAWSRADMNGNGLCSLAELEAWVLQTLLRAYPKKKKTDPDKGRDLWTAFRPCYIRAFKDAADYAKDDGAVLKGTKTAKADDFVSKDEFRLFCAYLSIYASMVRAHTQRSRLKPHRLAQQQLVG